MALRDIGRDEEIFIDYGKSWEDAWDRHVASWTPPKNSTQDDGDGKGFVPVSDMNLNGTRYLLTRAQINEEGMAYPHENVRIGCNIGGSYHPCEIINRTTVMDSSPTGSSSTFSYFVEVQRWTSEDGDGLDMEYMDYMWPFKTTAIVENIQAGDIKFFNGPYSSDQHLPGTFRHHIGVPQDMWPEQWMYPKDEEEELVQYTILLVLV